MTRVAAPILLLSSLLCGCIAATGIQPEVLDLSVWHSEPQRYRIQRHDTLHLVAWKVGVDFRKLAQWNELEPPYQLIPGELLWLSDPKQDQASTTLQSQPQVVLASLAATGKESEKIVLYPIPQFAAASPSSVKTNTATRSDSRTSGARSSRVRKEAKPSSTASSASKATQTVRKKPTTAAKKTNAQPSATSSVIRWAWPLRGKTVAQWGSKDNNRGMTIAANQGAEITAAADGKVVYAGDDLPGFGGMIIVKHNDAWLSAYAYNSEILVREEQAVKRGEKIAVIGQNDQGNTVLHFEIRHNGKPLDPQKKLPKP